MEDSLVHGPSLLACSPGIELLGGLEALPAGYEVDFVGLARALSLPGVSDDVETDDDRKSEVGEEEGLGCCSAAFIATDCQTACQYNSMVNKGRKQLGHTAM